MDYLKDLNSNQTKAVTLTDGPLLILAGAGTGKTKLLTYRILHLIKSGVPPHKILAVTFTNKAAKEMLLRIDHLITTHTKDLNLQTKPFTSTFHALGVHILRQHADKINRTKFFTILDRSDTLTKIKQAMKTARVQTDQIEPKKVLNIISANKNRGETAGSFKNKVDNFFNENIALIWQAYEKNLTESNALDFDDLLSLLVTLFKKHPEIKAIYENRWSHLHIDEYQDTNSVQYEIIKLLAGKQKNVCVVGDIDQSIYSWRGADFTNVFSFEQDFKDVVTIILEQNYRSTGTILKASNAIITKNINRKEKNLFTDNDDGQKIKILSTADAKEESRLVVDNSLALIKTGIKPDQIAVLYRANFQSRTLEEACLEAGLPYQVLGLKFFERKEIKDLLAYLKLALNKDDKDSFNRIINTPKRGLGKTAVSKILNNELETLSNGAKISLANFNQCLKQIKQASQKDTVSNIIKLALTSSGLETYLLNLKDEGIERLANLQELVTLAQKYDHLDGEEGLMTLLEEASLSSDQDNLTEVKPGIKLMTVHAAKGLEFEVVFIVGLEQGLFPLDKTTTDADQEEERRLFYVALTRARQLVFLSYAQIRTIFGNQQINIPSEFLTDIPLDLIEGDLEETKPTYDYLIDF